METVYQGTCEHCHQSFDWPEFHPNANPKRFCSEACRRKALRNKWVLKRTRRRRELSCEGCPTPDKWVWFSEAEARSHSEKWGNTVYRCSGPYPHYHVTSQQPPGAALERRKPASQRGSGVPK